MTCHFRHSLVACLAALLTACGGGGGGGGGGSSGGSPPPATPLPGGNNPPPVPPPPPALQPARLGPQTYQLFVRAAGSLIDISLSLGMLTSSAFAVRVTMDGTAPLQEACPQAGSIALELVDSDGNGEVSVGDRIVFRYVDCTFGDTVTNAVLNIDVQSMSSLPSSAGADRTSPCSRGSATTRVTSSGPKMHGFAA